VRAGGRSLRLGGAYRLTEAGLAALLARAPALEALALPQCSRLTGTFLASLPAGLRRAPETAARGRRRGPGGAAARGRRGAGAREGLAAGCRRLRVPGRSLEPGADAVRIPMYAYPF